MHCGECAKMRVPAGRLCAGPRQPCCLCSTCAAPARPPRAPRVKHTVLARAGGGREVVDLAASGARPGLLASLARDGGVRVWDARSGACLAAHASDAACLVRARRAAGNPRRSLSRGGAAPRPALGGAALGVRGRAGRRNFAHRDRARRLLGTACPAGTRRCRVFKPKFTRARPGRRRPSTRTARRWSPAAAAARCTPGACRRARPRPRQARQTRGQARRRSGLRRRRRRRRRRRVCRQRTASDRRRPLLTGAPWSGRDLSLPATCAGPTRRAWTALQGRRGAARHCSAARSAAGQAEEQAAAHRGRLPLYRVAPAVCAAREGGGHHHKVRGAVLRARGRLARAGPARAERRAPAMPHMDAAAHGEAGCRAVRRLRAQALRMEGGSHGEAAVDGALFLDAGRLTTRSADGRVCVWDFAGRRLLATWKARPPRAPLQRLYTKTDKDRMLRHGDAIRELCGGAGGS